MGKKFICLILAILLLVSAASAQVSDDLVKSLKVTSVLENGNKVAASVSFVGDEILIRVSPNAQYIIVEGEVNEKSFIITDLQYTSISGKFSVSMPTPDFFEIKSAEELRPVQKKTLLDDDTVTDLPLQLFAAGVNIGVHTTKFAVDEQTIQYQETNLGGFPILASLQASMEATKSLIPELNLFGLELFNN